MSAPKLLSFLCATVCALALPLSLRAFDPEPFTLPVSYSFRIVSGGSAIMEIQDGGSSGVADNFNPNFESPVGMSWMKPGKTYNLRFQYFTGVTYYWMSLVAPSGYQFYVNGLPKDYVFVTAGGQRTDNYSVEIRPIREAALAQGAFTGIDIGQAVSWELGLGTARAGHSVGRIGFRERDLATFSPESRERLFYVPPINSTQVNIIKDGPSSSRIRQIVTPRIMVDFVDVTNGYEVRYYNYDDTTWVPSTPIYTINAGKTPWRTIFVEKPSGTTDQLRITETDETATTSARVSHLTLTSGSISSGSYTWTLQEGGPSGAWLRTTTHSSTVVGSTRENTVTVREGGTTGTIVTETKFIYKTYPWGEDLYQVIANPNGGTAASTTTYSYHETVPVNGSETSRGNYGRLKAVSDSTGNWTATDYYDDWLKRGQTKTQYRPYLDAPASVSLDVTLGRVTSFEYTSDATGRARLPARVREKINNVETSKTDWTYDTTADSGLARVKATVDYFYGNTSSAYLRTRSEIIDPLTGDVDQAGEPCLQKNADGTQVSWSRAAGDFNLSTRVFTANTSGIYWRVLKISGTSTAGTANGAEASAQSSYDGQSFDSLYLVPNQSTAEIVVLDYSGAPLRSETRVYTGGGNWSSVPVSAVDSNYDFGRTNRLTSQVALNGATTSFNYTNGRLSSTVAESIETQFTYDALGRTTTVKKIGAPASGIHAEQKDITTTYNYNAADGSNYVTTETVSAAGTAETIVSQKAFDRAGRLVKATPPGLSATTISYAPASRTQTTTAPDGGTTTVTTYLDGSLKSTTGSAVVAQYYTYAIESDGRQRTQVNSGTSNSPRLQKVWADMLGRQTRLERPGFSQSSQSAYVEEQFFDATTGQLTKSTRTGTAPALYEYDALGAVKRTGIDENSGGSLVLASMDRIVDTATVFEFSGGAWWLKNTSTTYPDANAATHPINSISRTRLTGFAAGVRGEVQSTDAESNTATSVLTASAKLLTTRTTVPGLTTDAYSYVYNGLSSAATGHDGLTTKAAYDPLARPWKSYDSRSLTTTVAYYSGTALVQTVKDSTDTVVSTTYYTTAGRVSTTQDALAKNTRFSYNQRGQLTNQWGDGTYPISYTYDATYGERTGMSTYRSAPAGDSASWPSVGTADTTTWSFDPASGLLWKKTDATNKSIVYDYDQAGRLARRTWARGVYTSYAYKSATGELASQTYSDGTPTVTYNYTRAGQADSISDYTGTWDYIYDPAKPWRQSAAGLPSFYGTRTWTALYETSGAVGRYLGFQLGTAAGDATDLEQRYSYSADGRFDTLATKRASNAVTRTFDYSYLANTAFVSALGITGDSRFALTRGYETNRNLLSNVAGTWNASAVTRYDYTYDARGQRTTAKQSGSAFADYYVSGSYSAVFNRYGYNARGELESSAMYRGDNPSTSPASTDELPGRRFEFRFDSIGNRQTDGPTGDPANIDAQYTTNALNQYTAKENNAVRLLGTAATSANVAVAGSSATSKKDRAWGSDLVVANGGSAVAGSATVYAALPGGTDLIRTQSALFFIPKALQTFAYDDDGNLLADSVWTYTYDAENRLASMEHRSEVIGSGMIAAANARRFEFKYDYRGRRVRKTVYGGWNGTTYNATPLADTKYLYDGWNLVAEFSVSGSNLTLTRSYTWGLDLTGSLTASGGVGALVQIYDAAVGKTLLPTYDGNGNLAALLNADSGALEAAYEYDPSGNLLRAEGSYAATNPFRFSTKFTDVETGLIYYGLRYYSPSLGRFINRDPSEEQGGLNLYAFCSNNGVNAWDYLGMWDEHGNPTNAGEGFQRWAQSVNFGLHGAALPSPNNDAAAYEWAFAQNIAENLARLDSYVPPSNSLGTYRVNFNPRTGVTTGTYNGQLVSAVSPNGSVSTLDQSTGQWNQSFDFSRVIPQYASNSGGLRQTTEPGAMRSDYKGPDPATLFTGNAGYPNADSAAKASSPYLQAYQQATGLEHVVNIVKTKGGYIYTTAYAGSGPTGSGPNPFFGNDLGIIVGVNHSHPSLNTFSYVIPGRSGPSGDWVTGVLLNDVVLKGHFEGIYLAAPNGGTYVMPASWFNSPRPPKETLVPLHDEKGNYAGTDIQGKLVP